MTTLKPTLSFPVILLITINSILGTGIFFLPAVGARYSGPASLIAWLILSVICIYISMCFAELASMFPTAGGIYEFSKQAYGRFTSFLLGWGTLIAGNITIAMLVVGAIQYLLPANIPQISIPVSLLFIFIFNGIAYRGMKTSAVMLIAFSIITLGTLFGLIIPGLINFQPGNFDPFFVFPVSSIFVTIFFIAETFFGWETATFLAEETKDGQRVMPKVLIIATVLIAIISILVVVTSLGSLPWETFANAKAPLVELSTLHYGEWGAYVFTMLVYLAIIGAVAGWIVAAPRLVLAMARDRLFLKQLAAIHPKYKSPYKAIIFQTVLSSILVFAGAGSYETLLHLLVPLVLVMYAAVIGAVVVLRYKQPHTKRYFTVPFGKVGPYFIIAFLLSLIVVWVFEQQNAWQLLRLVGGFMLLGIPVYYLLELYYSSRAIRKTDDVVARLAYWTEGIFLPKRRRLELIKLLGPIRGKKILEFGCSVGTLTMHLAEAVGKKGHVYATDISEKDLLISKQRCEKKGHTHVHHIHDPNHTHRVHPSVPKVDAVISVGQLGYLVRPTTVLKHMNQRLKKGSRVVFMDYDKFFDLIPNIEWLEHDEKIQKFFHQAGFQVKVERKQGFAWKYIYIYGKKVKSVR